MREKRSVLLLILLAGALLLSCGCDASTAGMDLTAADTPQVTSPAQQASTAPAGSPAASPTPSIRETPPPAATLTEEAPGPPLPPEETPSVSPQAQPSVLADGAVGLSVLDVTGDGAEDVLILDPARTGPAGNVLLTVNGVDFETVTPSGADAYSVHLADLWTDRPGCELVLVREQGGRSELYLYGFVGGSVVAATFTYTIPKELTESGTPEETANATSLLFSGVEPLVSLGDGSFAVLGYGQGFERYTVDDEYHVAYAGQLPLDLLADAESAEVTQNPGTGSVGQP